ncbi:MAG: radial spoke protein 16 [Monoraphidium minutum]|nr:MAG: radial spoke protein 16 [Monoraphidium minutum]
MGQPIYYYEALGIARNSDDVEIKKAYRRLALKHHPDVDASDEAAAAFALVGEAYDVLSNPRTKGTYDLYGVQQLKKGAEGEDPYAFDAHAGPRAVFERFFGTSNPYEALEVLSSRFERLTTAKAPPPPPQKVADLVVTLEELYAGCSKVVVHNRVMQLPGGGGDEAGGGGGAAAVAEPRRLAVQIEPGMPDGTTFVFQGEGDAAAPGLPPGPLSLVLRAAPHARFERRGADLVMRVRLPLLNALAGGAVPIKALDGRVLSVPLDEVVTPGASIRVPGEGLPRLGGGGAKGDLVLEFDLLFPSNLSQQQKMLLRGALLLPPKPDAAQARGRTGARRQGRGWRLCSASGTKAAPFEAAKALRTFEAAFRDSQHGWSTGVLPGDDDA